MWGMLLSPKIFVCGIIVTTLLLAPSCLVALNNSGGSGQALHNPANGLQEINLPFTSPPAYTFSYGIKTAPSGLELLIANEPTKEELSIMLTLLE